LALLPPSTNAAYRGPLTPVLGLWFVAVQKLIVGGIHYFLPDGGAGVIAGLELQDNAQAIIGTFAWVGAIQIASGCALFAIAARYRTLVPLFLLLAALEQGLIALAAFVLKPPASGLHPPGHWASLVWVPGLLLLARLAVRVRRSE